jgi:hypothetical protein
MAANANAVGTLPMVSAAMDFLLGDSVPLAGPRADKGHRISAEHWR